MKTSPPAISFHNLTLGYDPHPAVHHITGDVPQGALLAIVGSNGAGKSTLIKGIFNAFVDQGLRLIHLPSLFDVWADVDYGVTLGALLLGIVLLQAVITPILLIFLFKVR